MAISREPEIYCDSSSEVLVFLDGLQHGNSDDDTLTSMLRLLILFEECPKSQKKTNHLLKLD